MKKNILLFLSFGFILSFALSAQQVGINATGNSPDASAMLDVASNNKGFLVPRMNSVDRNNINTPANGLIIYNTDCSLLNYYDCNVWRDITEKFSFPNIEGGKEIIFGKKHVAQNETSVSYVIPPVNGAISYLWTATNGATIASGQGTNNITVDFAGQGLSFICVTAINSCGTEIQTCLKVEVCLTPIISGVISGVSNPYKNSTLNTYNINSVPNADSYIWTVPVGATISSGQGTNTINVDFDANISGGDICVEAVNVCGSGNQVCFTVTTQSCVLPSVPTATNGSIILIDEFNMNWNSVNGATSYYIDIATDNNFTNFVPGFNNLNIGNFTTYNVSGLTCETDYYYRVRSENACGISNSSNVIGVTTDNCCPPLPLPSYTFTTCGLTGRFGPSQLNCDNEYSGSLLSGNVVVIGGIQKWIVPRTGTYNFEIGGAGASVGGGTEIKATINLTQGDVLDILIGQIGRGGNMGRGGGGGTFVVNNTTSIPIIIAGGAGGYISHVGVNGNTNTNGHNSQSGQAGGVNGNGGSRGSSATSAGSGGGGYIGDGTSNYSTGGKSFLNGGAGGQQYSNGGDGGFGGGGGNGNSGGGGGGGYSGGSGATSGNGGGGGGSYIHSSAVNIFTSNGLYENSPNFNGVPIANLGSYNSGEGYLTIQLVCP